MIDVDSLSIGQKLKHIPTGKVGRVRWLPPNMKDLPFIYITVDGGYPPHKGLSGEYIQQGQPSDFAEADDDGE